ncbi:MAG: precorrin-6y C5,15-methyltransferase (decarboxylating) subunit CbiE [Eubacterium sp.]
MMKVSLIGLGAGMNTVISDAQRAVENADILIGAPRLLELVRSAYPESRQEFRQEIWPGRIADLLLEKKEEWGNLNVALLFSGDTGFYSGAGSFLREYRKRLPENMDPMSREAEAFSGFSLEEFPGISSIQMLSSAVGKPWQDWTLVSAHGRDCDPAAAVRKGKNAFFLTGGSTGAQKLCQDLCDAGLEEQKVWIGENLGMSGQKITACSCREAAEQSFSSLAVVLVEGMRDSYPACGIPDEAFIRGKVPMTKRMVRMAVSSILQISPEETVWDVGAGTGSVSVELARQAAGGIVYAVECKEEACGLIRQNQKRFHLGNLEIIQGEAPEVLRDLPAADAVFIGGSNGNIEDIIREAADKNPEVRIVFTGIVLETVLQGMEALKKLGQDPEITQLAVSRSKTVGSRGIHMMTAENPIYIVRGQKE